jgi:hypothetical protein
MPWLAPASITTPPSGTIKPSGRYEARTKISSSVYSTSFGNAK